MEWTDISAVSAPGTVHQQINRDRSKWEAGILLWSHWSAVRPWLPAADAGSRWVAVAQLASRFLLTGACPSLLLSTASPTPFAFYHLHRHRPSVIYRSRTWRHSIASATRFVATCLPYSPWPRHLRRPQSLASPAGSLHSYCDCCAHDTQRRLYPLIHQSIGSIHGPQEVVHEPVTRTLSLWTGRFT